MTQQPNLSITSFIKRLLVRYPWLVTGSVLVTIASGFLDAVGLALIIPMAEFLAGTDPSPTNPFLGRIQSAFESLGIEYTLRGTVLVIIAAMSLRGGTLFVRHWLVAKTMARYEYDEKVQAYTAALHADWLFIVSQRGSDVMAGIVNEAKRAGAALFSTVNLLSSVFLVALYLALTLIVSLETTLIAFVGLLIVLALYRKLVAVAQKLGIQHTQANKDLLAELSEAGASAKAIKSSGAEHQALGRMEPIATRLARVHIRTGINNGILASTYDLAFIGFMAGGLLISIRYLDVVASSALLFALLSWRIFQQSRVVQAGLQGAAKNLPAAQRVQELTIAAANRVESSGTRPFQALEQAIELSNVSFGYTSEADVVHEVSMSIPAGSTVALVGPSGTGKTTIIDMLVGLLRPTRGSLLVDDVPLGEYDVRSWRRNLAYVAQGGLLSHDTVRNNIAWGKPNATDDEIRSAATQAHAHDFISTLREGYATVIGDKGLQLSGGQRQRLALAQALIRNPAVLIMDEATSELDVESERKIQDTLELLHGTLTIVLVTHRLSTVMSADLIYVLADGSISEQGSPAELLAKKGNFYRLHQTTFGQPDPASNTTDE